MSDGLISLILAAILFVGVVGVSLRYAFSKERDIQEYLRRAQTYRSRKNYDAAIGAYQRVIEWIQRILPRFKAWEYCILS